MEVGISYLGTEESGGRVGGWGLVDVTCERSVSGVRRGVLGGGWRGCGRDE